jgi:hypothetical protein
LHGPHQDAEKSTRTGFASRRASIRNPLDRR